MAGKTRKFNVLCVTKRCNGDQGPVEWHHPIIGVAEMKTFRSKCARIEIVVTVVQFQGEEHPVLYVRSGLEGSSVTIAIERPDSRFDIWELYTDIPAHRQSSAEKIREIAKETIVRNAFRR